VRLPLIGAVVLLASTTAVADDVPQPLPFVEAWSDNARIDHNNDWSGVPGVVGRRGNGLVTTQGADPRSVVADGDATSLSVLANRSQVTGEQGALAELERADPTIAMQASNLGDAPHLLLHLDTRDAAYVHVEYDLIDLDDDDDSPTAVALQFRVGDSGAFTSVERGFVADATTDGIGQVTHVDAMLPGAAAGQERVVVRILTTNQPGRDEWIAVDNVAITASVPPSGAVAVSPAYGPSGTVVHLAADLTPGAQPPSTYLTVRCDGDAVGAPTVELADDGAHDDGAAGDLRFGGDLTIGGVGAGAHAIGCAIEDHEGRVVATTIAFAVTARCGDGRIEDAELCDDGDETAGDGCAGCTVEPGWQCATEPSVCVDVNECEIDHDDCDPAAICTNVPGGWTCACAPGWSGDGHTCTAPDAMPPDATPPDAMPLDATIDAGIAPDAAPPPGIDQPGGCCSTVGGGGSGPLLLAALVALAQGRNSRIRRAASRSSS